MTIKATFDGARRPETPLIDLDKYRNGRPVLFRLTYWPFRIRSGYIKHFRDLESDALHVGICPFEGGIFVNRDRFYPLKYCFNVMSEEEKR